MIKYTHFSCVECFGRNGRVEVPIDSRCPSAAVKNSLILFCFLFIIIIVIYVYFLIAAHHGRCMYIRRCHCGSKYLLIIITGRPTWRKKNDIFRFIFIIILLL